MLISSCWADCGDLIRKQQRWVDATIWPSAWVTSRHLDAEAAAAAAVSLASVADKKGRPHRGEPATSLCTGDHLTPSSGIFRRHRRSKPWKTGTGKSLLSFFVDFTRFLAYRKRRVQHLSCHIEGRCAQAWWRHSPGRCGCAGARLRLLIWAKQRRHLQWFYCYRYFYWLKIILWT